MPIAYIFCYTIVYLSYFNNMWVPIEKKADSGDNELNLKFVSVKCRNGKHFIENNYYKPSSISKFCGESKSSS